MLQNVFRYLSSPAAVLMVEIDYRYGAPSASFLPVPQLSLGNVKWIWQIHWLDLAGINLYAVNHLNIIHGSRVIAIFAY